MQREHFSEFPSANIINWLKLEQEKIFRVIDSYDRIASNNAISLLQVRNAFWVSEGGRGEGGDEVQKLFVQGSVQGKILWNHLWEHRFSIPDPRVFPPPGGRFSAPKTENRIFTWAAQAAQ